MHLPPPVTLRRSFLWCNHQIVDRSSLSDTSSSVIIKSGEASVRGKVCGLLTECEYFLKEGGFVVLTMQK